MADLCVPPGWWSPMLVRDGVLRLAPEYGRVLRCTAVRVFGGREGT